MAIVTEMVPSVPVEPIVLPLPRPASPMGGSQFAQTIMNRRDRDRENQTLLTILEGHVPESMRTMSIIEHEFKDVDGRDHVLGLQVTQDYMTIGTDDDRLRMPMYPGTMQVIADRLGCMMPTSLIVDIIWKHANKVEPQPWGPPYDSTMSLTERYVAHNSRIESTMKSKKIDPKSLVAGHKKDVVLSNQLIQFEQSVFIYGWHGLDGRPIQGLPLFKGHSNNYADYSHGSRLVARDCVLDGQVDDLCRIARDPVLHVGVSREGPLQLDRQPA